MATQVSDTGSKGRTRGSTSDELALIAQRAQSFTNASGTAIALSEGSLDEIICRARSGSSAPDVGTALRVEGTFTGLCIQSGKELRCDDAETDTRVDTAAIRALGIRSMVVTPIKEENRVIGVLAVFAPTAHAFTITHVAVLKTMADQIAALLQRDRRNKEEGAPVEPARSITPAATPKAVVATPIAPPPVVVKPAAPAPAPAPAPRAAFPVVSKVEPIKTIPVADDITPASRKEEKRAEYKPEFRGGLASFDAAAGEEKKSGVSLIVLGVAAVVVIGAASTFAFLKMRKPASPAPPLAQHVPATTTPAPAQTTAPAPAASVAVQPATVAPAIAAPAPKSAVDNSSSEAAKKVERTVARNNVPERSAPERSAPEPETVALSAAPSKIATPTAEPGPNQEATPALSLGSTPGSGALSALAKSTTGAKPSMLTQSDLEPVTVLKRVAPVYPIIAKQRRMSGTIVVQAQVDKDGKVSNLQLISGPPIFRDAAFDAIKQWQFKPAMLNGQPIDQATQIRLQFSPN